MEYAIALVCLADVALAIVAIRQNARIRADREAADRANEVLARFEAAQEGKR